MSYKQQVREIREMYKRMERDPSYKRRKYHRRAAGLLILAFLVPMLLFVRIGEYFFGISPVFSGGFALAMVVALAELIGKKMTNKKFGNE